MAVTTTNGSEHPGDGWPAIPVTPPWDGVLMCRPDHFAVIDVKNRFMEGQIGRIDKARGASNLSSAVRVFVLEHYRSAAAGDGAASNAN